MIMLGLLVAALVNLVVSLFVGLTAAGMMISILISAAFVVLVSLLTAWETQMVKELYSAGDARETATQKSIFGAFAL